MSTQQPNEDTKSPYHQPPSNTKRAEINRWCCKNCGQNIFVVVNSEPPDVCEYCSDMTTWELVDKHNAT